VAIRAHTVQPAPHMRGIWRTGVASLRSRAVELENPEFVKLWIGESISLVGDQVTVLALPLTAVMLLSASPVQMGLLAASQAGPWLIVTLPAGAWVDRLPRRPVLIVANLGSALLLASIPITATLGLLRIEYLYVTGALLGTLTVFASVAGQAFFPSLVARSELVEANSKMQLSSSLAQSAGPGSAGILIQRFSAPVALSVDAVSFLISALLIGCIKLPKADSPSGERRAIAVEIVEGLRWLWINPIMRALILNTANMNLAFHMIAAIYVLYTARELGLPPDVLGLILTMRGVGAIGGAILAPKLAEVLGTGRSLMCATGLGSAGLLLIPLAGGSSTVLVLALGELVFGMGTPLFNVSSTSLRQALTPDHLQGRISAGYRFMARGTAPIGALLGGALGDALGLRPAISVGAACAVIAILWLVASPVRRLETLPTASTQN
jgi:MFS family permease